MEFNPQPIISLAIGAGGVISTILLLRGRIEKTIKDISTTVMLEHQRDCTIGTKLSEESAVHRAELNVKVESLRAEVHEGIHTLNGRLDRIFERLAQG